MATKTVASTDAKNHFGQILDDVMRNDTRYVVKRHGVPQVVIVSLTDFEQLLADESERTKMKRVIHELRPVYNLGEQIVQE